MAAGTDNAVVPIAFFAPSKCPLDGGGEQVAFTGSMHLAYSFSTDATGGFRERFHSNIHLEGVGLETGDRYVSSGAESLAERTPSDGASMVIDVGHFRSIHLGETTADDYFSMQILIIPGGVIAEREDCR
jgi:hypothetical protein